MSYIGNSPITAAFLTDTFSGNGTTTAFTMSVAPANTSSIIVAITGVLQDPSTYSVSGTTLTFSAAPPTGTGNISVRYMGIPASGVTTTAYRTVTDTTATAGQTSFSIPSYTVGYLNVFRNGSLLAGSDYTATTGTTVVLANAASAGDTITTESFYVSSVLNALPNTGGTLSGQLTVNSATGQKPLIAQVNGTEVFEVDASGNVGVGTSSPTEKLDVSGNLRLGTSAYLKIGTGFSSYIQGTTNTLTFGTNSTDRATIDSSGNLLVGTPSTSGSVNNNTQVVGGIFSTSGASGISALNATATTLVTLPNVSAGCWLVSATLPGQGATASYGVVAIVTTQGTTSSITTIKTATLATLSMSGLSVQITQSSGGTQANCAYTALRLF